MTKAARPNRTMPAKIDRTSRSTGTDAATPTAGMQPAQPVKQLDLLELLHKRAVIEIVIAEVTPKVFEVHAVVAWRQGRSVLVTSSGHPRGFRSLDTLIVHLKTLGIASTLVRLELLA